MMETTEDRLLDGRVVLLQPKTGQRASADAVMLAAAIRAKAGERILELGCGTGVAMLCLAARVAEVTVTGLELQPGLVALARQNIARNAMAGRLDVLEGDLRQPVAALAPGSFAQVFANPPYFDPARHRVAQDAGRALARHGGGAGEVGAWIAAMLRHAAPRGRLTLIQRVEQLPAVLAALEGRAGSLELLPLQSRAGEPAKRMILRAVKDGRGPLRLLPPLVLHRADGSYHPAIEAVLRDGAELPAGT